ncbi:MAG: cadherin domain-containing protein, partial [Bosea sp. (in: a-proteobacteria)]
MEADVNPDQTTTEQQKAGEERAQAVLAAAPLMADVLMIAAPEAGTRKVVDLAGARHLTFGFNLSDVTISIVDVDVVLTFANGSRLILPSFVLSMITTDPPKLAFNGAAVDPQSLIAAAGDVALVDQLPQLTLSDSARTQAQGDADRPNGEAQSPPVVQMMANQSYAHTAPPTARGEGTRSGAIDALNTGSIGSSDSPRAGDQQTQQTAGLKGEGALTERSDKIDGQIGNKIVKPVAVDPFPNLAPSITSNGGGSSGSIALAENQISVADITGSDPNAGDRLVFSIIGGEDVSRFAINGADGRLYFVEAPDFEAHTDVDGSNTYEVIVQVSDGKLSDSQTLLVTVNNVNEAPIDASISNATLGENAATGFFLGRVMGTDPDGGAVLTYSFAPGGDAGGRFAIDPITGDVTVMRGDLIDFEASSSQLLIVRVSDQDGLSLDRSIVVSVTDANDAPVITSNGGGSSAAITLGEGARTITTVTASDEDAGSVISFAIAGGDDAAAFQIDSVTGLVSFRVSPDFDLPGDANLDNVYLLVVEASDGQGGTDQQHLAVNVIVNMAPEITSYGGIAVVDITHPENAPTVATITAIDPENAPLTFSISGGADSAFFSINTFTGVLTFNGNPDFEGLGDSDGNNIYTVTIQAFDGSFADSQTLNITLLDLPEAPTILSDGGGPAATINMLENSITVTDVNATDPDAGTTLTYTIAGGADGGLFSIDATTGNLTLLSPADFENPADADGNNRYEVIVEVSDGVLLDQQAVTVVVQNANDAPVIISNGGGDTALILHTENNTAVTTVQATDSDVGATLIYTIFGGLDAALFTLNAASGALRFIANPSFETPADSNGDNTYQVIVRVLDGAGGVDVQTISVEVRDGNDDPVIISDGGGDTATRSVQENSTFVTTVQSIDPDLGATRSFSLVGGADAGFFTINAVSGDLSFVSGRDFENPADQSANNSYEVIVQVSDGVGGFDTQTITVNITGVNEAPEITSDGGGASASLDISENTTTVTTVTAVDPDAGATRSYAIVGGADSGRFTIDAAGALRFTAPQNFEVAGDADSDNIYNVVVQVSDNVGGFDTQALAVRVIDANEAPTAVVLANPMITLSENSVIPVGGVKVGDIVVTDDALGTEALSLGGPDAAFFQIVGTELFYVGPSPDFESKASYQVSVLVDDATVGSTPDLSLAVTVSVSDLNEAPSAITLAGPRLVAENAAAAVVGAISVSDPDAGSIFTYTVSDARFEVVGGNLRLRAGQSLNRETEASITLDVTATDQGLLSTTSTFTISVSDVDEFDVSAPLDLNFAANAVTENAAIGTAVGITARTIDPDATTNTVSYSLSSNPGGLFAIDAVTGVVTVASAIDREV